MPSSLFNITAETQNMMPQKTLEEVKIETSTWKRSLDFFMEETVQAKNRLSDILRNGFERNLLDELEDFQNQFIQQDEIINLLRRDITELDKLLLNENRNEGISADLIERKLENLRHNLSNSERRFCDLLLDFNRYLAKKAS